MDNMDLLKNDALVFGIHLDEIQLQQFYDYYNLLIEWNNKMNLTSITEFNDVMKKHFLDSISIAKYIKLNSDMNVLDIGTGAGFPGLPIKILYPDIKITLLDSLNKRVNFLNEIISSLNLKNVETIHGRAEDYARDPLYREKFDLVVSRAVANLSSLSELCLPFVKVGSKFVSYKSEKADDEIENSKHALDLLSARFYSCYNFVLPGTDYERNLVVINKISATPMKYPRKAGTPTKKPL